MQLSLYSRLTKIANTRLLGRNHDTSNLVDGHRHALDRVLLFLHRVPRGQSSRQTQDPSAGDQRPSGIRPRLSRATQYIGADGDFPALPVGGGVLSHWLGLARSADRLHLAHWAHHLYARL